MNLYPVSEDLGGAEALARLIGVSQTAEVAREVANGRLDPMTLQPFTVPASGASA